MKAIHGTLVAFSYKHSVNISLAYYPPYHSKYNPIEKIWGRLEQHWNRELLYNVDKALGLARTMTWKGCHLIVNMITETYKKGVRLSKKAIEKIENKISRIKGIEKLAVEDLKMVIPFN
jgi:transposase